MGDSRRQDNEKVCWLEKGDHLGDDSFVFPFAVPGGWVAARSVGCWCAPCAVAFRHYSCVRVVV